jgi:hypothetical protein
LEEVKEGGESTHVGPKECGEQEELLVAGSGEWWSYLGMALFCICFSGINSGLTVGLLSIDMLSLEI